MSVYTHLSQQDIEQFLTRYDIGRLVHFSGIEGGVENTNYFIDTQKSGVETRYVLTLFEYQPEETLPFFIALTDELAACDIPVPASIRDKEGQALHTLKEKPALIVPCLPGQHIGTPSKEHCEQMGTMLARIHQAGQTSTLQQENHRGIDWLDQQQKRLQPLLNSNDAQLMAERWSSITSTLSAFQALPSGLIHGDLFHDNVLFEGHRITAVIDFYNACHGWLIYDLAVAINDWCLKADLSLDPERCKIALEAYSQVRPFTELEKQAWPHILQLAAFRFWVSRIITFIHPEEDVDQQHEQSLIRNFKNPDEFRDILINRAQKPQPSLNY